ncbi:MAG: translocation/assembly module TamB domain-containing protein [Pseudomonadota bacterium]
MRVLLVLLLLVPMAAHAQNTQLEALLENQLSNESRTVEIDGFAGALSAQASLDALRMSDAEGLWLELTDVSLDWDRGALLRGRLEVRELRAAQLRFLRSPIAPETVEVPDAEASGFRIPDLPVAIQIDRLAVDNIFLGAPLLGEEVRAQASLSATLADGGLSLALDAARVDDRPGRAIIDLSLSPEEETLAVDLQVSEPEGGIVATALTLPGLPAVELTLQGAGPLDAFAADFRLATDGADRLTGRATLAADGEGREFDLAIEGDIRPLLDPGSRGFFGEATRVSASGRAEADGALTLDALSIEAARLSLEGSGALLDGAPRALALEGRLGGDGRSALPGSDITLAGADLTVAFDASVSDDWDLSVRAEEVATSGVQIESVVLTGLGQIVPGAATPFEGRIEANVGGLDFPGDPALQAAAGTEVTLSTRLTAEAGTFSFDALSLETAHASATGSARITPVDGRVALAADLAINAPDLAPFSQIAGMDLAGLVSADVTAEAELPGGAIAASLDGRTEGIDIGVAALEPLLLPQSTLSFAARRDEAGTRIEALRLDNPELTARVTGSVDSADGGLRVEARLREIGLFTDLVFGEVAIDALLSDALGARAVEAGVETAFGLAVNVEGALAGDNPSVDLTGTLAEIERFVPQLAGLAELVATLDLSDIPTIDAALEMDPGIRAEVSGPLSGPDQAFDIIADIADLAAFAPPLPGPARLEARVSDLAGGPFIEAQVRATPGLEITLEGRPTQPDGIVDVLASAEDLGFLVPQLAGPATVNAELRDPTGTLTLAADVTATPGLTARLTGQPLGDGAALELDATAASLGFLAPQLAGSANVRARLEDPTGQQAIEAEITSATGLTAAVTGQLSSPGDALRLTARAASLGRFVSGLSGGADVTADVTSLRDAPRIEATLRTDSGARANVSGQVGLPGGAVRIDTDGVVPLAIANGFASGRSLAGEAAFDLSLDGPPSPSAVRGTVTVDGARVFDPGLSLTLSPVDADIRLSGGSADLDARAVLDGVPINISGTAGLAAPFPLNVEIVTRRLPSRFPDILTSELSADIRLSGSVQQRLAISGDVRIEDVEIRIPDAGLGGATDIPSIRHEGAPSSVRQTLGRAGLRLDGRVPEASTRGAEIPLDLRVRALDQIFVRGRGLDAGFAGEFRITGTARDPIPIGQFDLTRGRLDFLGRRLDLDEGRITVAGALLPRIALSSSTTVEDITAIIALAGPVDAPELSLSSSPELPEDEILARVLFGRGIETLSAFQVARLVSSLRQLSGAGGAGLLEQARQNLGVDDIDLRTDAETGESALAIGAELDENVYTEVEVGQGGNTTINLNLDLNTNTTLRGSASSDGETGIGIFWERDY